MKEIGRRLAWDRMDPEAMSFDNKFLVWYAAHHARGQAKAVPRKDAPGLDMTMGTYVSGRFSLGVDDDGTPLLGMCEHEADAIACCHWVDGAFIRMFKGGDWVVLRTSDVRTDEPLSDTPLPLRLWLPAMPGLLDIWLDMEPKPDKLRLMTTKVSQGQARLHGTSPIQVMPLFFRGRWEQDT